MNHRKKPHTARPVLRGVFPARTVSFDQIPPEVRAKYANSKPLRWIRQFPIKPAPDEGPADSNGTK